MELWRKFLFIPVSENVRVSGFVTYFFLEISTKIHFKLYDFLEGCPCLNCLDCWECKTECRTDEAAKNATRVSTNFLQNLNIIRFQK